MVNFVRIILLLSGSLVFNGCDVVSSVASNQADQISKGIDRFSNDMSSTKLTLIVSSSCEKALRHQGIDGLQWTGNAQMDGKGFVLKLSTDSMNMNRASYVCFTDGNYNVVKLERHEWGS